MEEKKQVELGAALVLLKINVIYCRSLPITSQKKEFMSKTLAREMEYEKCPSPTNASVSKDKTVSK